MEKKMTIRPANRSDVPALALLLGELFSIEKDFTVDYRKHEKGLAMMLDFPGERTIMAAEDGGKVIGMCAGQLSVSTVEGGWSLWIEDMIVTEAYRGQGIGHKLISAVAEWGKKKGAVRLQLLADKNNTPAIEFYSKQGWKTGNMFCLRKTDF
ncbi:MAG: hypothetical protein A2Y33_10370 [Spirochaetes bacterium GWF1_51_8]|nr:MAG: hypothetical protein A2Y33_10370 [Spirochaetes bacterium GWF1_51_8]